MPDRAVPTHPPVPRELDALAALSLGMTIDELQLIYRVQFPVLYQYEAETFYRCDREADMAQAMTYFQAALALPGA
ncbi:hypothetical protein [Enhygromyxa salina]|nr:hypothetical protein [Enhygromyxa salina]